MQTEIEAKFLNADHDDLRDKLKELGATRVTPLRVMRRKNFDYPDLRLQQKSGWVRVRDEGKKVTLSYKQVNDRSLTGTKEVCLEVNDFDEACRLLEAIGLAAKSYQETKRESWKFGDVEVELDEWPWAKPYVEIEAASEDDLKSATQKLGLDWSAAVHGSVEIVYRAEYKVTDEEVNTWREIKFSEVPTWLKAKQK